MGYLHIENLYKNQEILIFKECYALEKIHGTSAHLSWRNGLLTFSSGGMSASLFASLFQKDKLEEIFRAEVSRFNNDPIVVYGEAYGGTQQKQAYRYGNLPKFVAFDVKVGERFANLPVAVMLVEKLGLEFVHWKRVPTDQNILDQERDAPSEQAIRNGVGNTLPREGVVLRPIIELTKNNGDRIICKHKRAEERETQTDRQVGVSLQVLSEAEKIAEEWVTPLRLEHVLDKLPANLDMKDVRKIMEAMREDVLRESQGEIVVSEAATKAISKKTVEIFKSYLQSVLHK